MLTVMIEQALGHFGRIDVLVNNAALFYRTPIDTVTFDDWERIMDVNLDGTFYCAHKIGLRMKEGGWGHIINMADVAGQRPWADYVPYSVSKACVLAFSQGLAMELAPEVMVNAVIPGPVLFQGRHATGGPAPRNREDPGQTRRNPRGSRPTRCLCGGVRFQYGRGVFGGRGAGADVRLHLLRLFISIRHIRIRAIKEPLI